MEPETEINEIETEADGDVEEVEDVEAETEAEIEAAPERQSARGMAELVAIVEALIFVADEPITTKLLAEVLGEDRDAIDAAVTELQNEYEGRESGLQIREIAGG